MRSQYSLKLRIKSLRQRKTTVYPEANFADDGTLNTTMVDLVLSQISAVQGSLMDIDMKAIAEEIQFDFSFFAMADAQTQAEEWFSNYQANSFRNFNEELESTFERNLLSKFSSYTNADSLSNLLELLLVKLSLVPI